MEKIYKCPKCGEKENLHFNYDYNQQHRPIKDVLCNECGDVFEGNMPVDIFIAKAVSEYPELEGTMGLCEDVIQKRTGKMTEEEWQAAERAQTGTKQENCCTPIGQIKRYVDCIGCDKKPKQETLEEVAERLYGLADKYSKNRIGFIEGAKWNEPIDMSDEEIMKGAKEWYNKEGAYSASAIALKTWVYAIRWYCEQLKKPKNEIND